MPIYYLYYDWLTFVYQHSSHCCSLGLVKLLNTEEVLIFESGRVFGHDVTTMMIKSLQKLFWMYRQIRKMI